MPKMRTGTDEVVVIPMPPGPDAEDAEVKAWIDRVQGAGVGLEGEELQAWAERVRGKAHAKPSVNTEYQLSKALTTLDKGDLEKLMQIFLTVASKNPDPSFKNFKNKLTKELDVAVLKKMMEDRDSAFSEAITRRLTKRDDPNFFRDVAEATNYVTLLSEKRQPVSAVAAAWGDLCKTVRQKRDWNQRQIAAVLGVRQATVSRWELGLSSPDPASRTKLIALAREIGVEHDLPAEEAKVSFLQVSLAIKNYGKVTSLDQVAKRISVPFIPISTRGEASLAIVVDTNDLLPRYEKGDVLIIGGSFDPAEMRLRECLVTRADGDYAFGLVRKLDNGDFFVGEDREGPTVVTALPVLSVVRQVALAL